MARPSGTAAAGPPLPRRRAAALLLALLIVLACGEKAAGAFVASPLAPCRRGSSVAAGIPAGSARLSMAFNKKGKKGEDLSYIETRDMTPDEMRALNAKNEDVMNAELAGMTIFSLVLSIPMLYLVWVGFFSETANVVEDALPY
jgi:hypothetical protein